MTDQPNTLPLRGEHITLAQAVKVVGLASTGGQAKLIVRDRALPLDLPKAASGAEVQEVLAISILGTGETRIDGERVDEEAILERARAARGENPDLRVAIEADGVVPHARVMHVLDLLRQAGVSRIGFGVVPYPAPSAVAPEGASE